MYHLDRSVVNARLGFLLHLQQYVCLYLCVFTVVYDFAFASLPVICVCSIVHCMLCKEACKFCKYSEVKAVSPRKCDTTWGLQVEQGSRGVWEPPATNWFQSKLQADRK